MAIFVNSWGLCCSTLSIRFLFLNTTLNEPSWIFVANANNSKPRRPWDMKSLQVASGSISMYHALECGKCSPHVGRLLLLPCGLLITPFFPTTAEQCMALSGFTRPLLLWVAQENTTLALLKEKMGGQGGLNGQRWWWELGVELDKPHYFICWVMLPSSDLCSDLRFWAWRIHGHSCISVCTPRLRDPWQVKQGLLHLC